MVRIGDAERKAFDRDGFVKLEGVISEEQCEAVIDAIYERLDATPDDPETWYEPAKGMSEHWEHRSGGMIELSHHQSLWNTRQHPAVYQAFAELLDEERLWVSMDRCNMTPPARDEHRELDSEFIHWDMDTTSLPDRPIQRRGTSQIPSGVQGVLYLDDTSEEQGGFQCVPSLYRDLDEWVRTQPDDRHSTYPDIDRDDYPVETIPGNKGDLLMWNRLLPHGNGHNFAETPRVAQYITMFPSRFHDTEARQQRIERWRTLAPFGEDPSNWERRHLEPAELTPLGRRLLGLDPWSGWLHTATE